MNDIRPSKDAGVNAAIIVGAGACFILWPAGPYDAGVIRWLFKLSIAGSVAVFGLLLAICVMAHWFSFLLYWCGNRYWVVVLPVRSGIFIVGHPPFHNGDSAGFHFQWHTADWADGMREDVQFVDAEYDDQVNVRFGPSAGLYYRGRTIAGWWNSTYHAIVPYWLLLGIAAPIPAMVVWRRFRRKHPARLALCALCGYDLRASSDRCPECGTSIPKAAASVPPYNS